MADYKQLLQPLLLGPEPGGGTRCPPGWRLALVSRSVFGLAKGREGLIPGRRVRRNGWLPPRSDAESGSSYSPAVAGIIHRAGGGDAVFGGRIVIKADLEQLCVTESQFVRARPGADPHLHRRHADSFYVLEGELAFLVDEVEHRLRPGACACAPAGVVHGFRTTSRARFLNFHTPAEGFAEQSAALDRGEPGGFDSIDFRPGAALGSTARSWYRPARASRLEARSRSRRSRSGARSSRWSELELEPGFDVRSRTLTISTSTSFYVLEARPSSCSAPRRSCRRRVFRAAPPGVVHTFSSGPGSSRLLNVHAPSSGFQEWLRTDS